MAGAGWPAAGGITPAGAPLCRRGGGGAERGGRWAPGTGTATARGCTMTLEELPGDRRTAGRDPDNVVLCLLAADEEEAGDAALQIHFTLIQAFCCENDINILRVSNPARLAQLLLPATGPEPPADLHCVLVTNPHASQWKDPALSQLMCFCRESRYMDQWVPVINLPER
ncbi:growth arrest and DNA damage-inducible protein GADD45 alpha isoform 2-T2 [Alca torda]